MNRISMGTLALAIAMLGAGNLGAQQGQRRGFGGFGPNNLMLLSQKSVQDELKLADDQVKKVDEQLEKQRGSFGELRDLGREERRAKFEELTKANDKAIGDILKEDQFKRLKQISLQQRGASALADPEVAQALALSSEQKDKISAIQQSANEERRGLFQGGGGDREEARTKSEAIRSSTNEKTMGLLSAEQKEKWQALTGEPFKGEIRPPGRGRGNGPAGAQRAKGGNRSAASQPLRSLFRLASFAPDDEDGPADRPAGPPPGDRPRPPRRELERNPSTRDREWRSPDTRGFEVRRSPGIDDNSLARRRRVHRRRVDRHSGPYIVNSHRHQAPFGERDRHFSAHRPGAGGRSFTGHDHFAGHFGPRHGLGSEPHPGFGHHHRGPHHFAAWHGHHDRPFDPPRHHEGDHPRPHRPQRGHRDGSHDHGGSIDASLMRLAQIERQLTGLARELNALERQLRR